MNRLLPALSSFVIVLLHLTVKVELLIVRRHHHDGRLYEYYAADSNNVRYSTTNGDGWDDLDSLIATHGLKDKSMFCTKGPGAWLLYQEASYKHGSMRQLKLVYGEHCVPVDNVNSLQPLGAVYANVEDASAVVAFQEKAFESKGKTIRDSLSQTIKSAIFVGTSNWTLEIDGNKTCVIILNLGDVCLLEDIQTSFSGSDQVSITKGCSEEDDVEQYQLQTCYSTGFHLLTYDYDFSFASMQNICSGDYDPADQGKEKFFEVVDVWKKRMSKKITTPSTLPSATMRLNLLNEMIKIMAKTCSNVQPDFLEIIYNIYMVHINNGDIWNVTVTANGVKPEQNPRKWNDAQDFIMKCAKNAQVNETNVGCKPEDISEMKNEKEIAVIEDFLNGETYDYVIEHVWLLLNYVATYCSYRRGFDMNHWSIFPLLFKRDFLYPLKEQWKNPGKWATFYPLMFNGYAMEDMRKKMISCVQAVIKQTPFYDPLARPPDFYVRNHTESEKDIIGGVTTTTTAPTPIAISKTTTAAAVPPTNRRKRQEKGVTEETSTVTSKRTKAKKSKPTTTVATTDEVPTTSATISSSSSKPSKAPRKSKKHKQQPTIITIGTTSKPTTVDAKATETAAPAVTPIPTVIDAGITTIEIGSSATNGSVDKENKDKDKKTKKKKKKTKGKHPKTDKDEKHTSKLLKSTLVEKQLPPVTEPQSTVKPA